MNCSKGIALYNRAKQLIPGGTQLLSKRPEMFLPDKWPSYYSRCKGVEVWDLDGNKFTDMTICGVGACVLGYADPDVDAAVYKAVDNGSMSTLNCPEEVELAEELIALHPWSEMLRYTRTGGEAMAVAIRIARAATEKEIILFCGYHGWHDWYLSANLAGDNALDGHLLPGLKAKGIVKGLKGTAIPFVYNDLDNFESLINKYKNKIAAVVMEPVRSFLPKKEFLEGIRQITKDNHIVLVFDEITSGFRLATGGAHLKFQVDPDMAVFAKALGNGYPMAAILGKQNIMKAAEETFISSTYWTDRIGPSAALAMITKYKKLNVSSHLNRIGNAIQNGWRILADKYQLNIDITGIPPLAHWDIKTNENLLVHTVITKEMLERGFLTSKSFYATYSHTEDHVQRYLAALDDVLNLLVKHIKKGTVSTLYDGSPIHAGFKRLT